MLTLLVLCLAGPPLLLLAYRFVPPPVTPLMLIRLTEGEDLDYRWRPAAEISSHLAPAVIAAEDNRFCEHWGFDFVELGHIFDDWMAGDRPRGASTISMQTTKNLLLWPQRHFSRKLLEAWLTPQLELLLPKSRIIELYLNVVEFGPGIYGAEAAAQYHFGKSAADLSPREAALLAAALPNPRQRSAGKPSPGHSEQAKVIEKRIGQLGPLLDCAF